ncbi:MAG: pyridoxamine 5'-phosphate oxidase family protein [Burkholderiales bacterium]
MNTPLSVPADAPFHSGELAVQRRLGLAERMHGVGQRVIRPLMTEQHRQFFAELPFVMIGAVDSAGRPWASMLVGEPGFMQSPNDRQLDISARAIDGDPLADGLRIGAPLGFLGIELHTRRRNRMNGQVRALTEQGISVAVEQTAGNCPQYIQGREFDWVRDPRDLFPRAAQQLAVLDADALRLVGQADTLFVATQAPAMAGEAARGADVSHRGGRAGFVKIEDNRTLLVPDFAGNNLFMTLGNMQLNARAGVLFIDFDRGDLLTLTGRAEVVWDGDELKAFDGAERAWRFHLDEAHWLRDALPLRWRFRDWSPNSLITGRWDEAAAKLQARQLAQTWRPYRVTRTVDESSMIRSFHLEPADDGAVPAFEAGQYLPIRLALPDGAAPLQRTYTISSAPGDAGLRLSIKRAGAASTHLHERVAVGNMIEALGPRGHFTIDALSRRPAVLIGAGVGITPMMSFVRHIVAEGFRHRRIRPVYLIQVARDAAVRAFAQELNELKTRADGAVRVHLVQGQGGPGALVGPLTVEHLKQLLPFDDHEFYLCGPSGFMQAIYDGLRDLGVRDERVHAEAFGPASLRRRPDNAAPAAPPPAPAATQAVVRFSRSRLQTEWTPAQGTLLELAEAQGLSPPFSCRVGHCGSCVTTLQSGRVTYAEPTDWRPGDGEVLICCARPAQDGGRRIDLDL